MSTFHRPLLQASSRYNRMILSSDRSAGRFSHRGMATGSRGARGHGWYVKYRGAVARDAVADQQEENRAAASLQGSPNRHLQHEYVEGRMDLASAKKWNEAVLALGSTAVYMDLVLSHHQHGPEESHRLEIDLATTVMPDSTRKFIDLLPTYQGTKLGRYEKRVAWCGGSGYLTRNMDEIELPDPRPLWHLPGTLSMLQRDCLNGQFMLLTHVAPHLDGIHLAIGTARNVEPLHRWGSSLLTVKGIPTAYDIIVRECGLLTES